MYATELMFYLRTLETTKYYVFLAWLSPDVESFFLRTLYIRDIDFSWFCKHSTIVETLAILRFDFEVVTYKP